MRKLRQEWHAPPKLPLNWYIVRFDYVFHVKVTSFFTPLYSLMYKLGQISFLQLYFERSVVLISEKNSLKRSIERNFFSIPSRLSDRLHVSYVNCNDLPPFVRFQQGVCDLFID